MLSFAMTALILICNIEHHNIMAFCNMDCRYIAMYCAALHDATLLCTGFTGTLLCFC